MRVGIIAVQHESNTFLSTPTTVENFRQDVLLSGNTVRDCFAAAHHEIGGFFEGLAAENVEAIPIFAARAVPSGMITADAAEQIVTLLFEALDRAGADGLDGLLVAPHGAAVAESHRDFDGHWLSTLRARFGDARPIICTLDLHANLSRRMVDACNATIGYRTNPHLDQCQRGIEAARLIARTLRKEVRPVQAMADPPIAINIERQLREESPCKQLYERADELLRSDPRVLSNSVLLGFPYADVAELGTSTIAVADNDPELAQRLAHELADYIVSHRTDFLGQLTSIEQAISMLDSGEKRICLLDTGDNVGGGSPGDGTLLVTVLHERGIGRSLAMICDPESVAAASSAGVNARISLRIGGKTDLLHGAPFEANCTVLHLHDGSWSESQPRHGGYTGGDMGVTAVVRSDRGVTIVLTSRRQPPFSLAPIRSSGIDPKEFDVLVAKGVHAPVAAYREVCQRFIRVNTPGVTNADMTQLTFHHRRRPMFPFESIDGWPPE